jgi:hypothetical protein
MVNVNANMTNINANQSMGTQYMYFFIMFVFLFRIFYKYIKLYKLKKGFKNDFDNNKTFKKYMKNSDDVQSKFREDKLKEKKNFYWYLGRIIFIDIMFIILQIKYPIIFSWVDIIIILTLFTAFYKYLFVFHADKKIFNDNWENKKEEEFIKELTQ